MEDKVVLLTGAASGIGAATAMLFASKGYGKLALLDLDQAKLEAVATKCREHGAEVMCLFVNLADFDTTKGVVKRVIEKFQSKHKICFKTCFISKQPQYNYVLF